MPSKKNSDIPLYYKGRPLVRSGDEIYFGNPEDSHMIYIQILSYTGEGEDEVADRVYVRLLSNAPDLTLQARTIKESEKVGIWGALDIGIVWLDRALAESGS
ncbi:MAG: hypothetical protein GX928_00860 [Ruminococcaceae bacterium]|nr:hypothetical protein [Oscillospiraceae bacterium]